MDSTDRARDAGMLNLASTFFASFPPSTSSSQERRLSSLKRVREDGLLTVHVGHDGADLIVRVSGELDMASAETFEHEVRRALKSDALSVVLDLDEVSFVDSTGLRALLMVAELMRSTGRRLRMVKASKELKRLVEVSGVKDALPLGD